MRIVSAIFFVVAFLAVCGYYDAQQLEQSREQYCYMVWLRKHDRTAGWPDYNHTYQEECTNEGTPRN